VVVLDTKLTPELIEEGLFRDVLSKVQAQRKDMKLDFSARIHLGLSGSARVITACESRVARLKEETLAVEVKLGDKVGGVTQEAMLDGESVHIDIKDVGAPPQRSSS
jgi:isoleucyl-tRNA synthetase